MANTIEDVLREAIRKTGWNHYQVWKRTGMDQGSVAKFMAGKASINAPNINALLDALGLEVKLVPKRTR
jgi:hypothetical protein